MYIESSPTTAYLELPLTLIDGNSPIDYGTLESLQLRYLDCMATSKLGELKKVEVIINQTEYNLSNTIFDTISLTVPSKMGIVSVYRAKNLDNLMGNLESWEQISTKIYFDGNLITFDGNNNDYRIHIGDGNYKLVDGNYPSITVKPRVLFDSLDIDLSRVETLGRKSCRPRLDLIENNNSGGLSYGEFNNILLFDSFIQCYSKLSDGTYELLVITFGPIDDLNLSITMTANIKYIGAIAGVIQAIPANFITSKYDNILDGRLLPWQRPIETLDLIRVEANTIYKVYRFDSKLTGQILYYIEGFNKWVTMHSSLVAVVDNLYGDLLIENNGTILNIKASGKIIIVDSLYGYEPKIHRITYKSTIDIPEATSNYIILNRSDKSLKGVVIIDGIPNWCKLSYKKPYKNSEVGLYEIYYTEVLTKSKFESITNKLLLASISFNKLKPEGLIEPEFEKHCQSIEYNILA